MSDSFNIQAVHGPREAADTTATQPGALTQYDDGQWTFTGNGKITPTEVMSRVIEVEAKSDDAFVEFIGAEDAGRFAAEQNLARFNRHLKQTADQPVSEGEQFMAQGGRGLKELLAPFKNNLNQLRHAVEQITANRVGMGPGTNKATGRVAPGMLGLPTDPKL